MKLSHLFVAAGLLSVCTAAPLIAQAETQVRSQAGPAASGQAVRPAQARPATPNVARPQQGRPIGPVARPEPRRPDPAPGPNQQRLRNACFGSDNPPPAICRRVYGQD